MRRMLCRCEKSSQFQDLQSLQAIQDLELLPRVTSWRRFSLGFLFVCSSFAVGIVSARLKKDQFCSFVYVAVEGRVEVLSGVVAAWQSILRSYPCV
mmetsp:Transcript_47151/g.106281  ORF Transcript_47151/g.106281 Transcript_47151/m.106281 type:complete len:96 (-) Transcript_47151:164-451(-)